MTIRKKFFISLSVILVCAMSFGLYLLYQEHIQTRNFRSGEQKIVFRRMFEPKCIASLFSRNEQLEELHVWGSAYPNMKTLDDLVAEQKLSPGQVYVYDLTYTKMPYVDHHSLKWYGYKDIDHIRDPWDKNSFFRALFLDLKARYYEWTSGKKLTDLTASDLFTEKELIEKKGYHYIEPLKDNWRHDWTFIDDVLTMFEALPKDAWVYFHCAHGHGRTTSMMLLYDIYKSAKEVPLDAILDRQYCIGGEDITNTEVWANGTWSADDLKARERMIFYFYEYMHDANGYGKQSFSAWRKGK